MIRHCIGIGAALSLGACATHPIGPVADKAITVNVDMPTAVSCVPPDYTPAPTSLVTKQSLLVAPDLAARYQMLASAWTVAAPYLTRDEAIIAACQRAAVAPASPTK